MTLIDHYNDIQSRRINRANSDKKNSDVLEDNE